jgi:hypothetical protein
MTSTLKSLPSISRGSQANAVDGDGAAQGKPLGGARRAQPQRGAGVAVPFHGQDLPLLGNNSGKHQ